MGRPAEKRGKEAKARKRKGAVKSLFLDGCGPLGECESGRKSGESVEKCEIDLCKPESLRLLEECCGKPLWKTLWRVWKSHICSQESAPLRLKKGNLIFGAKIGKNLT